MKRLRIEVPGSSANLGPGFDAFGLALDIVDTIHVELEDGGATSCQAAEIRPDIEGHGNLLCQAYHAWGEQAGIQLPGAYFRLESKIPIAKGLGSSAASIVAGLAAGAHAAGEKDPRERILQLAARMEGHADNAAAAVLGGMTVGFLDGDSAHVLHVANHLSLGVALFVPRDPLLTSEARAALPRTVPLTDAVFDVGRAAYLATALIWGRWDKIAPAMQDRLHQPHRARLIPGLEEVIAGAVHAGAYGAALSGGGPSVIALGPAPEAERFAAAMEAAAREVGWEGKSIVTRVRHRGVDVKEEPASSAAEQSRVEDPRQDLAAAGSKPDEQQI
jgi:homoserine kinase